MQRTYLFTEGVAYVFNKESKKNEEVSFKIPYSELNNTDEKIIRKVEKKIGRRVIDVDYEHYAELRLVNDEQFY